MMCFYAVVIFMKGKMKIYSTLLKFIREHILLYEIQSRHMSSCSVVCADKWTELL